MARVIDFEGRLIEVPDDATDDEVRSILSSSGAPQQAPQAPSPGRTVPAPDQNLRNEPAPEPTPRMDALRAALPGNPLTKLQELISSRAFQVGAQGTGAGVANTVMAPFDLAAGAQNLVSTGLNSAFGTNIPMAKPASEIVKDAATAGYEALGGQVIPKAEMTPKEKLAYNISDYGTQALSMGTGLAMAAPARQAAIAAGSKPAVGDAFIRPYMNNAPSTVAGDVAGGVGAGAAVNAVENNVDPNSPWRPLATGAAALAGGIGGVTAKELGGSTVRGVTDAFTRGRPDVNIPVDPLTNQPVTRGVADTASRMMQTIATNPATAARAIRENADTMAQAGLPQPSIGLVSGDVGMMGAETAARTKNGTPFVQNDNRLRDAATDRVSSLRDPGANQGAVTAQAQATPDAMAASREASAIPLLRQAEANTAPVDAKPIADLIDQKLATAKREPVRNALAKARTMLNKPGTEELDNSVAGLYESRKAINDIIEGRTDNSTGRFAQKELVDVRDALDAQIAKVSPEFPQYLQKFKEGSQPINELANSKVSQSLIGGEDPRNVARRIFTSQKYGTEKELDQVNALVGNDPAAKRGWKAAVSEVLSDEVLTATRKGGTSAGTGPEAQASLAQLDKVFRDNRPMLAKVYDPEEMNRLQQAHAVLDPLRNASVRATAGSDTADKAAQLWRIAEAGLKAKFGVLKGGGYLRTLRVMAQTLPDDSAAVQRVIERAWFDPDIAEYLLTNKVRDLSAEASNAHVRKLIAGAAASRESN